MTRTHVTTILAMLLAGAALSGAPEAAQVTPRPVPETAGVLKQYCVTCHNQRAMTANFSMDLLDAQKVQQNPAAWEKVRQSEQNPDTGAYTDPKADTIVAQGPGTHRSLIGDRN